MFGPHGITGMNVDDLRYELTASQAYALLRLFGEQSILTLVDAPRSRPHGHGGGKLEASRRSASAPAGARDEVRHAKRRPGSRT